jgi:NAD(P)-dependent dehydrogenase (short-subunit alcohol dehydrogenase family)
MNRLQAKTALITGAARGIGAQIARRFTQQGREGHHQRPEPGGSARHC